jgi:hypothetical protein
VCSSIYVSDIISPAYDDMMNGYLVGVFTFYLAVTGFYNTGRIICDLSKSRSSQAMERFLQTIYVSHYLTPENEFQSRMRVSLNNFKALAPTAFNDLFQLIRDVTQGNQLLTASFTNAKIQYNALSRNAEDRINILSINPIDPSCNCAMSIDSCRITLDKYCNSTYTFKDGGSCYMPVFGLVLGCYSIDSLLSSTLECLYDLQCIMPRYNYILFD